MDLLVTAILFIIIDALYLYTTSNHFIKLVKTIQKKPLILDLPATLLCYLSLIFSLYYFIIKERRSYLDAGILGFSIYSVYEFTNKAIFKDWDWFTVIIDTLWGSILFTTTTYLVYKINGII